MQKLYKKLIPGILVFTVFLLVNYWLYLSNYSKIYGPDGLIRILKNKEDNRSVPTTAVTLDTSPMIDLPLCPGTSPYLVGPISVEFNWFPAMEGIVNENPKLQHGGRFKPQECISSQKVAVIIPFRNRFNHLPYWLYYLHPVLQRQQLDYTVYVINQHGDETFNKARLMNAGYFEALKEYDYDCFLFSDVDLIPMDDRNIYRCFPQPRHLAVAVDKFGFRLCYSTIFGGVTSLSKEQFLKINGFSNRFWGWGGEDDAIQRRIVHKGMSISRPDETIGKYKMIKHPRDRKNDINPNRFQLMADTQKTMDKDGLNSLQYTVVEVKKERLFTFITVDIGT